MQFNSQICTTQEQSERLIALGLKKETADMHYHWLVCNDWPELFLRFNPPQLDDIPAWSLHRLIEIANLSQHWECISGNWYEEDIATIQSKLHIGEINKNYLKE